MEALLLIRKIKFFVFLIAIIQSVIKYMIITVGVNYMLL